MLSQQIRRAFIEYFKGQGHSFVPSSPVVPHDDPTLLFCNAGMNQFKDVFTGKATREYSRATNSQKCVRVGGKHNDLENVGHTSRHLTFFEMLGNFSFGDYFKEQAIQYAWEVSREIFGFDKEKLWASVYRDDDEAFELWKKYLPEGRIVRLGEKDNFWAMGDTGPCGPCSELHYDRGEKYGHAVSPYEDTTGERFVEYWNLVFMEFNRDASGKMTPLPKKNIDTGAGLERILALKGGHDTLFETDVLKRLIDRVEELSDVEYDPRQNETAAPFRVIADHLRCLAFAIADGVQPSNVDRGYVLRKVLRRAVRYGRQLGMDRPFLAALVPTLVEAMGEDFREIATAQSRIEEIVTLEEENFLRTLRRGGNLLNRVVDEAKEGAISGDDAFKLKDTYGLPLEEILLLAKDSALSVDLERYQKLEQEAKERSRKTRTVTSQVAEEGIFVDHPKSVFTGYGATTGAGKVTGLVVDGQLVDRVGAGQEAMVILDQTPFYAEKGGQVGDTGELQAEGIRFAVQDTQEAYTGVIAHIGKVEAGELKVGDQLEAVVDADRRGRIIRNHTATHLLHWALHQVLGEHATQKGSVVAPDRLRFDFSHHKGVSQEEIRAIEDLVAGKVRENLPVATYELTYSEAQGRDDIIQFFGDKYGAKVRVVDFEASKELCGGTHAKATGDVGAFVITEERSIAAGVRRIVAATGVDALAHQRGLEDLLADAASLLKTQPGKLLERINSLVDERENLAREIQEAKGAELARTAAGMQPEPLGDLQVLIAATEVEIGHLRDLADQVQGDVVILGSAAGDRCALLVKLSDAAMAKGLKAGALIKQVAPIIGGGGGGKADFAQAGGKDAEKLPEALDAARTIVAEQCSP